MPNIVVEKSNFVKKGELFALIINYTIHMFSLNAY